MVNKPNSKQGYLLLEVLIVLFVLSIVVLPWLSFIRAIQFDSGKERLSDFFATKKVFLKAFHREIEDGQYTGEERDFLIIRDDGALFVRLMEDGFIKEEITGVSK